jgi:hypothetical protein
MVGIGAEQRNIERECDVPFYGRRVVRHEVRDLRVGERTPDLLEHLSPFEQLLAKGAVTAVVHGDEPQTLPRRVPESPGSVPRSLVTSSAGLSAGLNPQCFIPRSQWTSGRPVRTGVCREDFGVGARGVLGCLRKRTMTVKQRTQRKEPRYVEEV